uniref:Uncharacterized protein n=2 Tax=Avena sativa TaxID=4498 RepID=A0ACD5TBV8_AVESA
MPPQEKHKSTPPVSGVDRIGALPDHMIQHVISFLPAQAAVRTCVLARQWRHLWRSTTGLRIVGLDDKQECIVHDLRKFVDHLLILRGHADLNTVEIKFDKFLEDDVPYVNLWTRFALMHRVQALTLYINAPVDLCLDNLPLVSPHLRTLDLYGVALQERFLDFASCPALEDLKMDLCDINAGRISSSSLKHLSISISSSDWNCRVHVSTPGLISLKLVDFIVRFHKRFETLPYI